VAVMGAHAQDYYYGADPAPSMYAAQAGQMQASPFVNENGQPIPAAPSMDAIMAGNQMQAMPYAAVQQMMPGQFESPQPAFVEQPQQFAQAAPFATQEAEVEEAEDEDTESESEEESTEGESEVESEAEGETESDDARFQQVEQKGFGKKLKKFGRKLKNAGKKVGRALKKAGRKIKRGLKKLFGKGKKAARKAGLAAKNAAQKLFKPKMGKPKNNNRAPSVKTPKAAGGKKLPPMPAPLPPQFKIDCKKNPRHCIDAETPAEGEEPGDHSPKAVFKKKIEVIKRALMKNNRNIAAESKWIDQVELIMKQYALKVKKVKEHIGDERKAIKELLRQRRIILNEKKQKELELRLKMATTELTSLTDALSQVKKKEQELGSGKTQLGAKISTLVGDLKKLKTDKAADETQALKKAD